MHLCEAVSSERSIHTPQIDGSDDKASSRLLCRPGSSMVTNIPSTMKTRTVVYMIRAPDRIHYMYAYRTKQNIGLARMILSLGNNPDHQQLTGLTKNYFPDLLYKADATPPLPRSRPLPAAPSFIMTEVSAFCQGGGPTITSDPYLLFAHYCKNVIRIWHFQVLQFAHYCGNTS